MGKVVSSGLHRLQELFGESVFDLSQELHRLRTQLQVVDREKSAAATKELRDRKVGFNLIAIGFFVMFISLLYWIIVSETKYESKNSRIAVVTLLMLDGASIGLVLVTHASLIDRPTKKRMNLARDSSDLRSQIRRQVERYASAITERLQNLTSKRAEVGRIARLGDTAWLFYCPSYTALLDFVTDEMMLVNTVDCRDVQLSYKELERRSVSVGNVQSALGRSLTGAAIGGLVFGEAGMIVGSVIGSAGERKVSMETIEKKIGKHVVDFYTRLQEVPVVTVELDDDKLAKEFYGVMSAAVARPVK